jgi:fumarylpyruvate hydrolase
MAMLFEVAPPPLLRTVRGDDYPVRRVFCIGRNYAAHAREMGRDPDREPPFFFTKWADTVVNADPADDCAIAYPPETSSFHFEVELVVAMGGRVFQANAIDAERAIWGYAVGLDMTRRDLQLAAREAGRPWDIGKNVDQSSPTGRLIGKTAAEASGFRPDAGRIRLSVDGAVKQDADLSELIWSVPELVSHISRFYPLHAGDLIYTGTPAGVGAVLPSDRLSGEIAGLPPLAVAIAPSVKP